MSDSAYHFPVAEVGLGQMGVLRHGRRRYEARGAALQQAARLLHSRLEVGGQQAGSEARAIPGASSRRRRRSNPLRPKAADGRLEAE